MTIFTKVVRPEHIKQALCIWAAKSNSNIISKTNGGGNKIWKVKVQDL